MFHPVVKGLMGSYGSEPLLDNFLTCRANFEIGFHDLEKVLNLAKM